MTTRRGSWSLAWAAGLAAIVALTVELAGEGPASTGQPAAPAAARPLDVLRKLKAQPQKPGTRRRYANVTEGAAALPTASITEPFEIGEALYDPSRTEQAVVSLLARMHIAIVAAGEAPPPGGGLQLDAAEVRTLVEMTRQDIEGSDGIENLPYSFADVHRAVSALLPSMSVEQLAQAYSRAYEAHGDALAAKVLMGQPIEPGTRLTRAHLWLLLMDGFGAPAGASDWGTADRELPDLKSPRPQWTPVEWKEVLARAPLLPPERLLAIEVPTGLAQSPNGPAATVNVVARLDAKAPALVSRITGKTLFAAKTGSLAGLDLSWQVAEDSALRRLGKVITETDRPIKVGPTGTASFVYQPGADPTRGRGILVREVAEIGVETQGCELVKAAYDLPPELCGFFWGGRRRARVPVEWRATEALELDITNIADVTLDVAGIRTGAKREAADSIVGTIARNEDGTYSGVVDAEAWSQQSLPAPNCTGTSVGAQQLYVLATPIPAFGITHPAASYLWSIRGGVGASMASEPPDGGHLSLEFFPVTEPAFDALFGSDPCQPMIPADPSQQGHGASRFLPFNDAQWTIPHTGYGVALRQTGVTDYQDHTSAKTIAGSSIWYVRIERKVAAP